ncbi:MAG: carbohydrate binding family 9 domain-containing protein [Planctomycetes bacterium]|nr:carbohydrate binding family 9 domain-containing protein [Planctomycetota bacterium]
MSVRLCLLLAPVLGAAAPAQDEARPDRRTATVGRVETAAAPRLDGRLDEACWRDAPSIGDLVTVEPWEGRAPTQRTVVKLLHDSRHLYIGLYCFDDEPQHIRATQRSRDARLDPDDRVEILLDPFQNRRTAYFFQIGAGGSIGDALVSANGTKFDKPWDTIWDGAARVVEDGWVAEIAIPFRSLPRANGGAAWGFNLRRYLRTRNEEHQWANAVQSVPFFRISEMGNMVGFGAIDSGIGLEVVPYLTAGMARDRAVDRSWDFDPDLGGEIYYRITPSLTLAATALTDFAETESDGRQINFNRFPLFFPEKRDFFLQGTSYFAFGAQRAGGTNFLPYFTRRIGLDGDGGKVPLLGGVKLTGESGPFEIGLLDVQTDDTAAGEGANLGVAKLKYAIDEQTTVGMLATNGDPAGGADNRVGGVDLYHRWSKFVGDMDLQASLDYVRSSGGDQDDEGESFGVMLESHGSELDIDLGTRWVSDDFDPAMGYVSRHGIRTSTFEIGYDPRMREGGAVRNLVFEIDLDRQDRWDGEVRDLRFGLDGLGVNFHSGDRIVLFGNRHFERVESDFLLFHDSTAVLAGDYWTTRGGLLLRTSEARPWDCQLVVETGGFFDGTRDRVDIDAKWRVSPLLHTGVSYEVSTVDLGPGRGFDAHVAAGRLDLHFTPAASLLTLVQFDNESNEIGWQSRLRWIYSPGCDFFAVLGSSWHRDADGAFVPEQQTLELKISHSLRF